MHFKTLAVLPQCGIGDLIQHLWYLRSIAEACPEKKLTIMIKPRSLAKEWIDKEPWIEKIEYLERKDLYQRAFHLRKEKFQQAWVFHRSFSHALFSLLAGIPQRFGPGCGPQALCLTNPPLPRPLQTLPHLELMGAVVKQQGLSLKIEDQRVPLKKKALATIAQAYHPIPSPLVTLGIGASEEFKKWPLSSFVEVAIYLRHQAPVTILLSGGPADRPDIERIGQTLKEHNIPVIMATHWNIAETFALLSYTQLYIGNDTSLLNASACLGIPAVGLFGATPILSFSPHILPVYPFPHTPLLKEGMVAITPQHVIEVLEKNKWTGHYMAGKATLRTMDIS